MIEKIARGVRNNNPLNLRKSENKWLGKIVPGSDSEFEQFTSMVFGIRAAMINARTILRRNPKCTVRRLIEIWAPPVENSTSAYVSRVCQLTRKLPHESVKFEKRDEFVAIIHAMATVENGQSLPWQYFNAAYDLLR